MIFYALPERPQGEVKLTILDAAGEEVKTFSSKEPEKDAKEQGDGATTEAQVALGSPEGTEAEEPPQETARDAGESKEPKVPVEPGLNRFVWNLRYADPRKLRKTGESNVMMEDFLSGPLALPGRYQVRLTIDGREYTESFEVLKDPTVPATQQELEEQFKVLIGIRDRMSEINDTVNQLRDIRQQVEEWERRVKGQAVAGDVAASGKQLRDALTAVEEELLQVKAESALSHPAKLKEKLVTLGMIVASADAAPTKSSQEVYADLSQRIDQQLARFKEIVDADVAAFNQLLRGADLPAVMPMPLDAR